jgi:antitoxin MazE
MKTAVQRWGNSLALRIPSAYASETNMHEGSQVELSRKGDSLVVKLIRSKQIPLKDMLKQITPDNLHEAVDTGIPVGKEML